MNIKDEMQIYDGTEVSSLTGETGSYDNAFFPNVIRRRELELIEYVLRAEKPKFILDYGCGGGWLSVLLQKWGLRSVGIDISRRMVRNAKIVCPSADFIVCDAMRLPFKDDIFDFVIGISILHHLNMKQATDELKRISLAQSAFLFMEPSAINPLSAFGRKVFPMQVHTKGEKPYMPQYLNSALSAAGFTIERFFSMFFLAYPAARFSRIARLNPPPLLVKMIYFFEGIMEEMPGIKNLNSNIVAIAKTKR
ncbi:MAG: class I SAM-dependent methyltransferase [Candidatus Bathyarchaeia archaeon]|jgi:SAM-dependent methyltransferase